MSLTTTPQESQFFVLDFGGGTFAPLAGLPHVAGVGTRSEPDVVRRIVAEVTGVVDRREAYFRAQGIDSIETYRSRRRQGRADDGYGDVFLVVDGWSTLRADFDDLELELQQLAARGLTFGLHIVAAAARWADFRAAMRDVFGTRLELRLGDPVDSEVDRKVAALVPTRAAGPRLWSRASCTSSGRCRGSTAIPTRPPSATASTTWSSAATPPGAGRAAPSCGCCPSGSRSTRSARRPRTRRSTTGCCCSASTRRSWRRSGSTWTSSRTCSSTATASPARARCCAALIREIVRTRTAKQAQLVVVDYRRSLLGEVPEEYQLNYLTSRRPGGAGAARPRARTSRAGSPGPTSRPSSCATARGGPARRRSCSSTTTTWSPPSRARRSPCCSR